MKVKNIVFNHTYSPNQSCGTGYDESYYWDFTYDDGTTKQKNISLWYRSEESVLNEFLKVIKLDTCDNFEEAYLMFIDAANKAGFKYDKEKQKKYLGEHLIEVDKNIKDLSSLFKEREELYHTEKLKKLSTVLDGKKPLDAIRDLYKVLNLEE